GGGQRRSRCLSTSRHPECQVDVGEARQICVGPPVRGDTYSVGQTTHAKDAPRSPRELGGNRNDEQVVRSRSERMTAVRVGEIQDVAADACPETVPSFVWGDNESVARSSQSVNVALGADWGTVARGDGVHDAALFRRAGCICP